jgi:membrane peptidoglycan carboxypeptidase
MRCSGRWRTVARVVAGGGARTWGRRAEVVRRALQHPVHSLAGSRADHDGPDRQVRPDGVLLLETAEDGEPDHGDARAAGAVPAARPAVEDRQVGEVAPARESTFPEPLDWTRSIASERSRRRLARRLLRYWWVAPLTLVVAVSTFLAGLFLAPLDVTPPPAAKPAELLDVLGRPVTAVQAPATPQEIPGEAITDVVRSAAVAAVDPGFQSRAGVDPFTLVRAAWHDVTGGGGGPATITQRYVASALLDGDENLPRTRAAALGLRLEQRLSRQEILTRYLNTAYFGNGAYGIQAAALAYFGVPAPALTLPQAAMLGGILVDPERANPYVDPVAARARQLATLTEMTNLHMISSRTADEAGRAHDGLRPAGQPVGVAADFTERTARELSAAYGERALYSSALQVGTTLDLDLQTAVDAALTGLPARTGPVAVAAVDPRDGGLRALGHSGSTLAATPADTLLDPFRRAAQLGGGDGVGLAEAAGLHAAGTDPLSAAQAYGTLVAGGRRAQLRDVLSVTLPAGASGRSERPLPVPQAESSAQVLPDSVTDQVRSLLMSSPLPAGARAAAQQFPLLAGASPTMFVGCTVSLCLAVQTGTGPAQPDQAPAVFGRVWAEYLTRAGERALPPAVNLPAPVPTTPAPPQPGSTSSTTPAQVPTHASTSAPPGGFTPSSKPTRPPLVRGAPPGRTSTPATPGGRSPAQPTTPPSSAVEPTPSVSATLPSASPPVVSSSPGGSSSGGSRPATPP